MPEITIGVPGSGVSEVVEIDRAATVNEVASEIDDVAERLGVDFHDVRVTDHSGLFGVGVSEWSWTELIDFSVAVARHGELFAEYVKTRVDNASVPTIESEYLNRDPVVVESRREWAWRQFEELFPEAFELVSSAPQNGLHGVSFDPDEYVFAAEANEDVAFYDLSSGQVGVIREG